MSMIKHPVLHAAAVITFLGSVAAASPVFAAPQDTSTPPTPPNSTVELNADGRVVGTTPDTSATSTSVDTVGAAKPHHHHKPKQSEEDKMKAHVEQRIKTLHDTLGITPDQESAWRTVAETMRDNETTIGGLIRARHANPENMTAVDDLESYQQITQAHAEGLNKLVPAFKSLYETLSDAQKKNADKVFGGFEGHNHK